MPEESNYYTPEGYVDIPYIYQFDCSGLTDGTSPQGLVLKIDNDSDFILRRVFGFDTVATGGMTLYNYSGSTCWDAGTINPTGLNIGVSWAVMPEKLYPKSSFIKFDLFTVARQNVVCAGNNIFNSIIGFQGVRRYKTGVPGFQPGAPQPPLTYDPNAYLRKQITKVLPIPFNWSHWIGAAANGLAAGLHPFRLQIADYDFELHDISFWNPDNTVLSGQSIRVMLYDQSDRTLFSSPVWSTQINSAVKAHAGMFPSPPLLYPVWTNLRIDVESIVCATPNTQILIYLQGVQRMPKN